MMNWAEYAYGTLVAKVMSVVIVVAVVIAIIQAAIKFTLIIGGAAIVIMFFSGICWGASILINHIDKNLQIEHVKENRAAARNDLTPNTQNKLILKICQGIVFAGRSFSVSMFGGIYLGIAHMVNGFATLVGKIKGRSFSNKTA